MFSEIWYSVSIQLTQFIIHSNPTLDRIFLKRRISKNIVCKQKAKLIDKTTSKHFETFIYVFVSTNIRERQKRDWKKMLGSVWESHWRKLGEQKKRIAHKLFHKCLTTDLQLYFYISALPLFKSFVLVFEQKEPMVHRFHDELKETLRSFLAYFLKTEKVKSISTKKCSK